FSARPARGQMVPIEIRLTVREPKTSLRIAFRTNEDRTPRALPLHRILVPWADTKPDSLSKPVEIARAPELEGGDWARGRKVFFGEPAGCSKCHSVHGRGGTIGPDLSNLVYRDYPSVYRDITQPSFAINPDYLTYTVTLKDGRVLTGVVRTSGNTVTIGDQKGTLTAIDKADVESMKPA